MCLFSAQMSTHSATMNPTKRTILICAGALGFTGVALGALGSHALRDRLTALGTSPVWQTAVLYHLIHSVAVLMVSSWLPAVRPGRTAAFWIAGVVLFSGSLYALALGGPKVLGPITPLGGICLLIGWFLAGWTAWKHKVE